jgi:hypothetical protein
MHNRDENKMKKINLIKKSEVGMGNRKNNFGLPCPRPEADLGLS